MGIINFICDVIRKIVIFFLSIIALVLLSIYVLNYPALNDPNNVMTSDGPSIKASSGPLEVIDQNTSARPTTIPIIGINNFFINFHFSS